MEEDPIHEGTHIYPKYCIYSTQVCTTFWIWRIIERSKKCVYGIIGISVSVCMCVFRWSFKTYFGLQKDAKVYEKI